MLLAFFHSTNEIQSSVSHTSYWMNMVLSYNLYIFCLSADASKDLKTILLSLLEMVASKKVSGYGRDQALNLLTKNVPRKDKKEKSNSRTLFTIDHGKSDTSIMSCIMFGLIYSPLLYPWLLDIIYSTEIFINTCMCCSLGLKKILKVCGQVPELPDQLPMTENTQLIASVLLNKLYDDLICDPERNNFRDVCDEYIKYVHKI